MKTSPHLPKAVLAVILGAAYGLLLRIGFEHRNLHPFLQIVSTAFLVVCPFSVGAISVLLSGSHERISIRNQVVISISTMSLFLVAMFATFLEGLICIILVAPVFLIASILGGLLAGLIHNRWKVKHSVLPIFALLPFLAAPYEGQVPQHEVEQSVRNTIHINAPADVVFQHLAEVRDIQPEELGFSFMHVIGLPRPLSAEMSGRGLGSVRISKWEKNVWFKEEITSWTQPVQMRYRFIVPRGGVPREALDRHVEINGEYFDLVDGGYDLLPTKDGGTDLTLTTRFLNKSHLKLYGNIWGKLVLSDFHKAILGLMKSRSEMMPNPSFQRTASGGR